ncbi:hypothetical protein HPP92_025240 [Vanilla planifolia]|uniref:Uncharacterized protein n=1 Tax=Vanilla planifolia TaxID=51239 RepID=A0A835UAU2_VANPL|nr:hypothetical protein HPP92_025240 [Vanilla planifolia]
MEGQTTPCPAQAFLDNSTLCACDPGFFLSNGSCQSLSSVVSGGGEWKTSSGLEDQLAFLSAVLPLESIRRLTRSQEVLYGATLAVLLAWLAFCIAIRFGRLGGGETIWFRVRWWISRLDLYFDTRHWQEDNRIVVKRKTELGGAFSVASWILYIGLFSALLYQIISKRTFEVQKVRPTDASDLKQFDNDMEFNITTVSSMTCSHLRGLEALVIGIPDLAHNPASAVGFHFNLNARDHVDHKHTSYVSGTLNPGTYRNGGAETLRGPDKNIMKIHLFPQKFNYKHHLRLIQPLLHDFFPGSSFSDVMNLRTSLQSSKDGMLDITLHVRYLSDYIVEVDKELIFGFGAIPVPNHFQVILLVYVVRSTVAVANKALLGQEWLTGSLALLHFGAKSAIRSSEWRKEEIS